MMCCDFSAHIHTFKEAEKPILSGLFRPVPERIYYLYFWRIRTAPSYHNTSLSHILCILFYSVENITLETVVSGWLCRGKGKLRAWTKALPPEVVTCTIESSSATSDKSLLDFWPPLVFWPAPQFYLAIPKSQGCIKGCTDQRPEYTDVDATED